MKNTTMMALTETQALIVDMISARAVYGDDAAFSWRDAPRSSVASTSTDYVISHGTRYRIATLDDGSQWLAVRRRGVYEATISRARFEKLARPHTY